MEDPDGASTFIGSWKERFGHRVHDSSLQKVKSQTRVQFKPTEGERFLKKNLARSDNWRLAYLTVNSGEANLMISRYGLEG